MKYTCLIIFGEDFPIVIPSQPQLKYSPENNYESPEDNKSIIVNTQVYFGKNYPDPFNSITYIPYFLPYESNKAILKIYNINSSLLREIPLKKGYNLLEIRALESWSQGIYFYTIEINGEKHQYDKMILIK
ncbi:MAG: T9SS type A sorting domain-containing protein [Bacteroidota bacterium]